MTGSAQSESEPAGGSGQNPFIHLQVDFILVHCGLERSESEDSLVIRQRPLPGRKNLKIE